MAFDVFISYSHKDRRLRDELTAHLSNVRRQGLIKDWYDGDLIPGSKFKTQILTHLNQAKLILLLISADFMASDFCFSIEMRQAIARHQANQARVIPPSSYARPIGRERHSPISKRCRPIVNPSPIGRLTTMPLPT